MHRAFAVATIFIAGCSSAMPGTQATTMHPAWYRPAPNAIRKGVYIAEYFTNDILAYAGVTPNKNLPPVCSLPSDAATLGAANGTIYVGNIQATGEAYGNISVCTLAGGCSAVLANSAIGGELFGIAEDKRGNVYATGYASPSGGHGSGSGASLVRWKNGRGKGSTIAAYRNTWPGGLDFDRNGNLLALDTFAQNTGALWIYSGCPAHCVARGPFALKGESVYGKVDAKARYFEATVSPME